MAREASIRASRGETGSTQAVSVTTSSAATTNAINSDECLVYSNVECFVVAGPNPTAATTTGVPIAANAMVRLTELVPSEKLAFIAATGSGTAYVRPGA